MVQGQRYDLIMKSMTVAMARNHSWSGPPHLLVAVLETSDDGPAKRALGAANLTLSAVEARLEAMAGAGPGAGADERGTTANPRMYGVAGMARGLALAHGEPVGDVHAVLALVYDGLIGELVGAEGAEQLLDSLRASGVTVPPAAPPVPPEPLGVETRIYYPVADSRAVMAAMSERFPPPDSPHWGMNISTWKHGYHWLDADAGCEAGAIVRSVCADPTRIVELPIADAARYERAALR